jgi:hypothetical protein
MLTYAGKGLNKDYDLTKLTVPYLRNLSTIKYGSESRALAIGFTEKTGLNNKDIFSVVRAPKNMQYVANTLEKMERGELKVRLPPIYVHMYRICIHIYIVYMYLCMYVCMYACMYIDNIYIYIY